VRSGAQTLILLSTPLNASILNELSKGPSSRQLDLRRATGSPAQSTLRTHLNRLVDIGVIVKHRRDRFPGVLEFILTDAGTELLAVARMVDQWLGSRPSEPTNLGTMPAKAAIKALVESWSTTILRALAAGPLSLTELDRVISTCNYPTLERRLSAMRLAGQVVARPGNGRGTPYAVSDWLRRGVGVIAEAARWEQRHLPGAGNPLGRIDIEAIFLLALPLVRLPDDLGGSCRLAVELNAGPRRAMAGALVDIENGRLARCNTSLDGYPDAWITGTTSAWLNALTKANIDSLELGGDGHLTRHILSGLHRALPGSAVAA